ncbi:MAG TPA: SulP family inorganic anion transporter [Phycisphaerales bacterium]|nr:SulP family inorganic anion transporter [Phycisphaerales bacterium]
MIAKSTNVVRTLVRGLRPALVDTWREGYTWSLARADVMAAISVAAIALPFAIAVGIASVPESVAAGERLVPPLMGMVTAIVGGLLVSLLGGSKFQIGGPSGVSIAILYLIAAEHGYVGLALATLMAGVIIIIMGVTGLGAFIKFIPFPVTAGFTTGSAVIIATAQVRDFAGLQIDKTPAAWLEKVQAFAAHWHTWDMRTMVVGGSTLAALIVMRKFVPRWPSYAVGVIFAGAMTWLLGWGMGQQGSVATIASKFGSVSAEFHFNRFPPITLELVRDLVMPATTIAILVSIETLLSAVVADGMTGERHNSNEELVGLGVANIATGLLGGLPTTGGAARTTANVKAGARTPVSGVLHAVVMFAVVMLGAKLLGYVPLAALSAVLFVVAWNMSDMPRFRALLRTPASDVAVLLTTFGLTLLFGLAVAVGVGMVLASMLFIQRMSELSEVSAITMDIAAPQAGDAESVLEKKDATRLQAMEIPKGVEVFEINGPFFFAVADRLKDTLRRQGKLPRVFILRMRRVPHIDATGLHALAEFHEKCVRNGTVLLLGGVHAQPMFEMVRVGLDEKIGLENVFETLEEAVERAKVIVGT